MAYLGRPSAGDSPFAIGDRAMKDHTSPQPPSQRNPTPRVQPGQIGPNGFMATPSPYGSASDEARRRYEERYAKKQAEDEAKKREEEAKKREEEMQQQQQQRPPPQGQYGGGGGGGGGQPPWGQPQAQQRPLPPAQSPQHFQHPPYQAGPSPVPQNSFGPPSGGQGYNRPPPSQGPPGGYQSPPPQQFHPQQQQQQPPPRPAPPQHQYSQGPPPSQGPPSYGAHPQQQQQQQQQRQSYQASPLPPGAQQQRYSQQPYSTPPPPQQQYSSPPPPNDDHELRSLFAQFDSTRSGQLSYRDLQRLLEKDAMMEAREDSVKMLMNIFDTDRSGSINFLEFEGLYRYIQDWHGIFRRFDRDNSGLIDRRELHNALQGFGFSLPSEMVRRLEKRFAPPPRAGDDRGPVGISFDRFLMACVTVKHYTEAFRKLDGGTGRATMDYNTFMDIIMDAPS